MARFNHALSLGFTVLSDDPEGEDITVKMIRKALEERIFEIDRHNEWQEACLPPWDTFELE